MKIQLSCTIHNVNLQHNEMYATYNNAFLILKNWETDLQKSTDILLNPLFVLRNDLRGLNVIYVYKNEIKVKLIMNF